MKRLLIITLIFTCCFSVFAEGQKDKTGEKQTLRFSWWGGDARHEGTLAAIALYEEKNPNVSIEAEFGGWDGYYQKLVTQLAGGTSADIMQIDQPWLNELSSKGDVFASLNNNPALDISSFDQKFLSDFCSYEGSLKGLPTGLNGEILLVDNDFMSKYGITPDQKWDWDNLISIGAKIHAADNSQYIMNVSPDVFTTIFKKYLSQLGGSVVNSDKSLGFSKEEAVAAYNYFQQWIDKGIMPPFSEMSLYFRKIEENPSWLMGDMGSMLAWVSNLNKAAGEKTNTSIAAMPVMPGSKNSGILVRPSQILSVSSRSKNIDTAIDFINFFFNDPDAVRTTGTIRGVPPTETGRAQLKNEGLLEERVEKGVNIALSTMGDPESTWQMNSEVSQVFYDVNEQFGYGILTPEQAADELIKKLNALLANL